MRRALLSVLLLTVGCGRIAPPPPDEYEAPPPPDPDWSGTPIVDLPITFTQAEWDEQWAAYRAVVAEAMGVPADRLEPAIGPPLHRAQRQAALHAPRPADTLPDEPIDALLEQLSQQRLRTGWDAIDLAATERLLCDPAVQALPPHARPIELAIELAQRIGAGTPGANWFEQPPPADAERLGIAAERAAKWIAAAASTPVEVEAWQRIVYHRVVDSGQREFDQAFTGTAMPGVEQVQVHLRPYLERAGFDPWLKLMLIGRYHQVRLAAAPWVNTWREHSGPSPTMRDDGPAAFGPLTEALGLRPDWPEPAAALISVETYGGDSDEATTPRTWFDRAIAAQFDYEPAYSAFGGALTARAWRDDNPVVLAFANDCLATERFETIVPEQMAWIVSSYVRRQQPGSRLPGLWEPVDRIFAERAEAAPELADCYRSYHLAAAWAYEQHDQAVELVLGLGERLMPAAVVDFGADPTEIVNRALLEFGPHAAPLAEAEAAYEAGDDERAVATAEAILAGDPPEPVAQVARLVRDSANLAPAAGKPIRLAAEELPLGWRRVGGGWSAAATQLRLPLLFHNDCEVRGTVRLAAAGPPGTAREEALVSLAWRVGGRFCRLGLTTGPEAPRDPTRPPASLSISGPRVSSGSGFAMSPGGGLGGGLGAGPVPGLPPAVPPAATPPPNRPEVSRQLIFRRQAGTWRVWVDGIEAPLSNEPEPVVGAPEQAGISLSSWPPPGASRFVDWTYERLAPAPGPP